MDETLRQRAIELYDRFTHEGMERRQFMTEMTRIAGGAAAANLLIGSHRRLARRRRDRSRG